MFASLLQSMLPPGFDLEKTINDVKNAISTAVATVQRIEAKLDAIQAAQDATVTQPMTQGNDNADKQHALPLGNPGAASGPGDAPGSHGYSGDSGD